MIRKSETGPVRGGFARTRPIPETILTRSHRGSCDLSPQADQRVSICVWCNRIHQRLDPIGDPPCGLAKVDDCPVGGRPSMEGGDAAKPRLDFRAADGVQGAGELVAQIPERHDDLNRFPFDRPGRASTGAFRPAIAKAYLA